MFHAKNEAHQKYSLLDAKLNYIFILDLQKDIYKKVPKAHLYPIFPTTRAQKRIHRTTDWRLPDRLFGTVVDAHTLHLRPPETSILGTLLAPLGCSGGSDGHPKPLRDPTGATCVHLVEKWCSLDTIWEKTVFHFGMPVDPKISKSHKKQRKLGVRKTSRKKN